MRKIIKELDGITPLKIPVPPMLAKAMGYKGEARFVSFQWPPQPPIRISKEEYLAMVSQALKNVKQPDDIDIEDSQRRIEQQYALVEDMQRWLANYLKK
jgi:hypothetical protein